MCPDKLTLGKAGIGFEQRTSPYAVERATTGPTYPPLLFFRQLSHNHEMLSRYKEMASL